MKRALQRQKGVFALLLALGLGMGTAYAYSFSKQCSTGQWLYYNIINSTSHYVEITYPGTSTSNPWGGYTQPSGNITLPSSVSYNGVTYTVTKIGNYAFYQCGDLTGSLTIPNTVTSIGNHAFDNCYGFTGTLTLSNTLTTIGDYAFNGCCMPGYYATSFSGSLTIPNSVLSIGECAFSQSFCSSNTGTLTLGNNVNSIGPEAFGACSGFTGSLTIPNSVTSIGWGAFDSCGGFSGTLTIGTDVSSIGWRAFNQCSFSQVNFNATYCSNVEVDDMIFDGWGGTLTIGSSVQKIPDNLFNYSHFSKVNFNATNCILSTNGPSNMVGPGSPFRNCTGTLNIGSNVTWLIGQLFYECGFTQVNFNAINCQDATPGDSPFLYCHATLTIGSNVARIPAYMFENCHSFTGSLSIPSSVNEIGNNAFYGCTNFNGSLTIPNSVTSIGTSAFQACSGFTGSLTIGTGVTSIGASAFKNCTGFTQVKYNAINCADLTENAKPFEGCTATTLTIGSGVQRIPAYMFYECSNFTGTLTIPNSVTTIGNGAFFECHGFTGSLTIPNSVTTIGVSAFGACTGITGTLTLGNSVTTISPLAFQWCNFTGTLTIPSSVTFLYPYAFSNCKHFTQINYNAVNCADVTGTPFNGCTATTLTIGSGVQRIPAKMFEECSNFTGTLTIPTSVTEIGASAFKNCTGFTQVKFNAINCADVANDAKPFEGCTATTLTIGSSVQRIPAYMFYQCTNFTGSLNIPNSVAEIGDFAFFTTGFNGSLTLGSSLTTIGQSAFYGCVNFTGSLTIPNSVTTMGDGAFTFCMGFTGLTLGSSLTSIGDVAFALCTGFTGSLAIPNSVTTIGTGAFGSCTGFTGSLTIGNNVTTIGEQAFQSCGFTGALTIGSDVTSIAQDAFSYCTGFTSITALPETPPTLGEDAFEDVPTSIPVYVPCPSLEDYQAASGWSVFTNMQCIPETLTVHDGTVTNGFVPVYGYWADAYLKAEFVMPASELADMAGGTITSMKFYASQADVSWGNANFQVFLTEVADATISAFAGPGTVVYQGALSIVGGEMTVDFTTPYQYNGGNLLVGIYNTVKGSWATSTWYGESVTGASVQGYSSSSLSAVSPTQRNFIPKTTFGYTPSECSRPIDLNETDITISSATLQWTGYQDSYDLRYRKKPLFFEDFENGLPSGWTTIDNDGDGYDWHSESNYSSSFCHSGNGIMVSASYIYEDNTNIALTPDNWLITPLLDLQGTMKVWIRAYHTNYTQEHFAIYLSTTGNSVSEFTTVLVPETTLTNVVYHAYTADLSAYAGQQGYIAIRHFNCTDMYELLVDDFGLFEDPNGTDGWETLSDIGSGYTLTALEPETEYEWQVRGRDCDGEGSYTEWSAVNVFTTEALCAPEDQCELTFTLTDNYGDGWNGAAIDVYDEATGILLATLTNNNLNGITGYGTNELNTLTLAVCDGRELRFEWYPGGWDGECSYTVTSSSGYVVFSGSGAMSGPVTYMVKCDAVDQTVALSSGYNWFSANVEITLEDLQAALVAALPGTTITINSQGDGSTTYNGVRWRGTLTSLDLSQMYMINVTANSEITLEGTPVNPAEHPATIHPDFNWMAFPLRQSMTLTEAFTGFVVNGDMVTSQDEGSSTYTNRWRGSLNALEPGKGYMYKSSVSEDRVFSFTHGYVDLGLPSGLLWATCNVGAYSPEEYGDYFAWGETTPKDTYNWSTYQYCNGSSTTLTKYCTYASYGYEGFTDDLTTLLPEDDAATANWGEGWRMPTKEEWQELYNNTTVIWTTQNGVNGRLFTASNGNSLFLPAAGYRYNSFLGYTDSWGVYWSSSLRTDYPSIAWYFYFDSDNYSMNDGSRAYGRSVRPVRSASQN